jgi:hypothetical protein
MLTFTGTVRLIPRFTRPFADMSLVPDPMESKIYRGPSYIECTALADDLEEWREALPNPLKWNDGLTSEMPNATNNPSPYEPLFVPNNPTNLPITHRFSLDILIALLRSRYLYARYIIYLPFVYKALHYPDQMSNDDFYGVTWCLKACLHWPVVMSPPKDKKRILPHLFSWTHCFIGMIILFKMIPRSESLTWVKNHHFSNGELEESLSLMLDWIADMKQVDGIAWWASHVIENLRLGESGYS